LQLRQFHLQLAFPGARVPRKNVEDQLGTVDHSPVNDLFDVALLRSRQVVIKEKKVGIHRSGRAGNLLQFARADQRSRIRPVTPLQDFADNFRPRAPSQRPQFRHRFFCVKLWNGRLVGAGFS
jgi:hypothetical protein